MPHQRRKAESDKTDHAEILRTSAASAVKSLAFITGRQMEEVS
jgi:hypothetical protein